MKNLILFSILALLTLSSCGTLEITRGGATYRYPSSLKVDKYYDFSLEEDYRLIGQNPYLMRIYGPSWYRDMYQRNWRQKYVLDDDQ